MNEVSNLAEGYKSVPIPKTLSFLAKLFAFSGPGYLVAVGYMDPGNWATDLQGGSRFGYVLLSIILLSSCMAILLQYLAVKLGVATGKDLAQVCRERYSKPISVFLWLMSEVMITACDLAEVLGSAIALELLFHIPLVFGILITGADVLLLLLLQNRGVRYMEALVVALIGTIAVCLGLEVVLAKPELLPLLHGFIPTAALFTNRDMFYISLGIIGATVMPHNLFLHSSIVQTRAYSDDSNGKRDAIRFAALDSTIALTLAFLINVAILVVATAVFYNSGHNNVADIEHAYQLLTPLLGTTLASVMFAIALLASGQNSTMTGTLTGQIIMEGFLNLRMKPWLRRLITRSLAIVPAILIVVFFKKFGVGRLLVLSQIVLSIELPFAVIPLVIVTSSREAMGEFVNSPWLKHTAYAITAVLVILSSWLVFVTFVQA